MDIHRLYAYVYIYVYICIYIINYNYIIVETWWFMGGTQAPYPIKFKPQQGNEAYIPCNSGHGWISHKPSNKKNEEKPFKTWNNQD